MNVASIALCRELYELSGWDGYIDGRFVVPGNVATENGAPSKIPRYDLGYILRKLPEGTTVFCMHKLWNCGLVLPDDVVRATADTPEDAACKLAIELFKQGILK